MNSDEVVAYFSMEIALRPELHTYSGGLGVLAGDTIRSAADLRVPMVAVTLAHRKGYFNQHIDSDGWQSEDSAEYAIDNFCRELPARASVRIEGRSIRIRAWEYIVTGVSGRQVRTILLDTNLPENTSWDRELTDHLYGGDAHYRLCQEVVLGMGGVRMLRALGYNEISRFHMNEGHAALLGLELLDERARRFNRKRFNSEDVEAVKQRCVFTTHTPVPAGHDRFPFAHVGKVLGRTDIFDMHEVFCCEGELNMTYLALNLSHYINGVTKKHGEISRQILAPHDNLHNYEIDHITNGVHLATWASQPMAELFNRWMPGWREDNAMMRGALAIPGEEIEDARRKAKRILAEAIKTATGVSFSSEFLTLGFARRAATYKRANLILSDKARLKNLASSNRPLQIVFAGKAHPQDDGGKRIIQEIVQSQKELIPEVRLVYLENYDMELAKILVSGVDVWVNTPYPPMEASGTSGMKAALNGVPNLSVLDGWWIEGHIDKITGWAIGEMDSSLTEGEDRQALDAESLYFKLETEVIPTFYDNRKAWTNIMRSAIALGASYFNTQRMVQQYVLKAYFE